MTLCLKVHNCLLRCPEAVLVKCKICDWFKSSLFTTTPWIVEFWDPFSLPTLNNGQILPYIDKLMFTWSFYIEIRVIFVTHAHTVCTMYQPGTGARDEAIVIAAWISITPHTLIGRKRTLFHCMLTSYISRMLYWNHSRFSVSIYEWLNYMHSKNFRATATGSL